MADFPSSSSVSAVLCWAWKAPSCNTLNNTYDVDDDDGHEMNQNKINKMFEDTLSEVLFAGKYLYKKRIYLLNGPMTCLFINVFRTDKKDGSFSKQWAMMQQLMGR